MVVFWSPDVKVGEAAGFQLSLTAPSNIDISCLPITSLAIHFTEDFAPLIVRHMVSDSVPEVLTRRVDLGHVSTADHKKEVQTDLRWKPGSKIVFTGTMSSDAPIVMTVCSSSFHRLIADQC
jgi:trafficking protein particle complex subunit 11